MLVSALKAMWNDESGAVTVDWVVLTAAIVGIGFFVIIPVAQGTESMSGATASMIDSVSSGYGGN